MFANSNKRIINGRSGYSRFTGYGLATAFATVVLLVSSAIHASELRFITHSSELQTYIEDGQLRGTPHAGRRAYYIEVVREMMKVIGISSEIRNFPFARGMQEVQTKDNIAFFNVTRTSKREGSVKWGVELLRTSSYFYELVDAPTGIKTLEDAKQVSAIGVLRGGVHHEKLEALGFTNVIAFDSYSRLIKMLRMGRIDLASTSKDFAAYEVGDGDRAPMQTTEVKVSDSVGYLCFSKNVSNELLLEWQNAFDQLERNGKLQEIKQRYLLPISKDSGTPVSVNSL